jgi:two-component system, LytTR family, response regulator AlgR
VLNVLIVDDEAPARDRLCRMVDELPQYAVVGTARSGEDALDAIETLQPDILLLDISMPGMDGMKLAQLMQRSGMRAAVIFCSAYQNQALEAFEAEAIDYLVKPVRAERLLQALEKARRYLGERPDAAPDQYLRSTVGGKVMLIPVSRVICLMAEDKYTTVVHENGNTVIEESLLELEARFPQQFFRIHRNALVSRAHLRGMEQESAGRVVAVMSGTDYRPEISRRNYSAVRRFLKQL